MCMHFYSRITVLYQVGPQVVSHSTRRHRRDGSSVKMMSQSMRCRSQCGSAFIVVSFFSRNTVLNVDWLWHHIDYDTTLSVTPPWRWHHTDCDTTLTVTPHWMWHHIDRDTTLIVTPPWRWHHLDCDATLNVTPHWLWHHLDCTNTLAVTPHWLWHRLECDTTLNVTPQWLRHHLDWGIRQRGMVNSNKC